jgi:hypothetical protein
MLESLYRRVIVLAEGTKARIVQHPQLDLHFECMKPRQNMSSSSRHHMPQTQFRCEWTQPLGTQPLGGFLRLLFDSRYWCLMRLVM